MDTRSYLGGLVTGEGCFCLSVQRVAARKGRLRITPVFAMFMSDPDTIAFAADALREIGLPVYLQDRPKAGVGQIGITVNGLQRVKRYCEVLIPVLTGQKLRAAEVMLDFIRSREAQPKGAPYTEAELEIVRILRDVNGNTRGKKNPL
jgi:hypothetical protein